MNFVPRYLGRGSWLAQRDPRLLVIAVACFILSAIQVWDIRVMVLLTALGFAWYRQAHIPFRAVRRQWLFAIGFVSLIVIFNLIVASPDRQLHLREGAVEHIYGSIPILGKPVSDATVTYAATQWLRFMGMIAIGFPIAFSIDPSAFGATFARLGVPYRFAFAIDLTWRFIPSFAADFRTTLDAQRVRGMDLAAGGRSPISRLRSQVPVVVPTVVNAIAGAEDTIDAMDLRSFGTGKRTWLHDLRFDRTDRLALIGFVTLLVVATIAAWTAGTALLWIPPFLIPGG
jgi:energy-coupling factor transport system permease protein